MTRYVSNLESCVSRLMREEWVRMEALPEGPAKAQLMDEIRAMGILKNSLELSRIMEEYENP